MLPGMHVTFGITRTSKRLLWISNVVSTHFSTTKPLSPAKWPFLSVQILVVDTFVVKNWSGPVVTTKIEVYY